MSLLRSRPLLQCGVFPCESTGAVFVRNPLNRELVATFEIIVSVHDNASDIIDMSVSVPNGKYGRTVCLSSLTLLAL